MKGDFIIWVDVVYVGEIYQMKQLISVASGVLHEYNVTILYYNLSFKCINRYFIKGLIFFIPILIIN